ncbi:hypothetical protein ACEPAF_10000 [Sanghuangporus sanghuang]
MGKVEWKWDEEEQATFEELKRCLSSPPVLAIPNNEDSFCVEADASDFVPEVEHNYEIYNKEMLTIVQALKEW